MNITQILMLNSRKILSSRSQEKKKYFFWVIKNITKFRDGAGAGVVSSESGTVGGAGGLGTVGAGAGA